MDTIENTVIEYPEGIEQNLLETFQQQIEEMIHAKTTTFYEHEIEEWNNFHNYIVRVAETMPEGHREDQNDEPLQKLSEYAVAALKKNEAKQMIIQSGTLMESFFSTKGGILDCIDVLIKSAKLDCLMVFAGPQIENDMDNQVIKRLLRWKKELGEKIRWFYQPMRLSVHGIFTPHYSFYQGLHTECNLYRNQYNYHDIPVVFNLAKEDQVVKRKYRYEDRFDLIRPS